MVRYVLIAFALTIFALVVLMLIVSVIVMLALCCAVGIPLYLMSKNFLERHGVAGKQKLNPIDRLKNLYVEGKIDLFEFERRVARLLTFEH